MPWQAGILGVLIVGLGAVVRLAMRSSSEYRPNPGEAAKPYNRHGTTYDVPPGD
jgi:hypothetical protein